MHTYFLCVPAQVLIYVHYLINVCVELAGYHLLVSTLRVYVRLYNSMLVYSSVYVSVCTCMSTYECVYVYTHMHFLSLRPAVGAG